MTEPILSLRGITKSHPGPSGSTHSVLADLDLDVAEGEFVAILGFSGSGKTTLVSAIAGLIEPDSGEVLLRGEPCTAPGRDRGVVFQSYSLMPWLTVEGNVQLAVDSAHGNLTRDERRGLVASTIDLVGLSHAKDRKPAQLSGGMRQRVAVARALAMQPEILLLDEPLSALDALTRARLQDEIERIRAHERRTIILVTNDVDEALLLADRVAVLEPGPAARIAATFAVNLERPRKRADLHGQRRFKALRHEIVTYLDHLANKQPATVVSLIDAERPSVEPDEPTLPTAVEAAARARTTRRYLEVSELTKIYPTPAGPLTVVDDISFSLDRGEFIALIGHSGCGKSTVLSMAAGLNDATHGWIALDGREIDSAGPDKAMMFQAPSLMPWLTARQNVALGVEGVYRGAPRGQRQEVVEYYLRRVGLGDSMDTRASSLSNGMRQRVGLARAFALSPRLLLLDEPFGMLDCLTRWDLQDVLLEVWDRSKVTTVLVTHDVDEAILLADKVVMMTNGPNAKIGKVLDIALPRPRDRRGLVDDPRFSAYRADILEFLTDHEHLVQSDVA